MAKVRAGQQTVLLVVDVQVGVMAEAWRPGPVIAQVAQVVARARAAGVPVVWVQHEDDEGLARGSATWQWVPALVPAAGEHRVCKRFNSSFEQTDLEAHLARLGATHLVLAGAATNFCIRATAYAALERGYDLTLVADAHTTGDMTGPDGTQVPAEAVVNDLNATMTWLQYPGRRNAAVPAAQLDWAADAAA